MLDEVGQICEPEGYLRALVQVIQFEGLEIAEQQVSREFRVLQVRKVLEGLSFGFAEAPANALLLHEEHSLPEQIDVTPPLGEVLDGFLEGRQPAHGHPEYIEEIPVEELCLALLVPFAVPFLGESGGPGSNLVPGETHPTRPFRRALPGTARQHPAGGATRACTILPNRVAYDCSLPVPPLAVFVGADRRWCLASPSL